MHQLREDVVGQAKQERWGNVNARPSGWTALPWKGTCGCVSGRTSSEIAMLPRLISRHWPANRQYHPEDSYYRERIRMRLGINANATRGVDLGLRLTAGNVNRPAVTGDLMGDPMLLGSPTSSLQKLDTFNSKSSLVLDQSYLKLSPLNWLTVSGARFPNPFFVGTIGNISTGTVGKAPHTIPTAGVVNTDLLWDVDLNFERLALNLHPWGEGRPDRQAVLQRGIFPLQQINQSETVKAKDKWFYGAQAGLEWAPENTDTKIRVGASFYDFLNISGVRNPAFGDTLFNQSATLFRQKGNSLFNVDNDGTLRRPSPAYACKGDYSGGGIASGGKRHILFMDILRY